MLSLYIHIPFCAQKCAYCSFYCFFLNPEIKEKMISDYLDALYKEIEYYANTLEDKHIKTIYLGGGTPNVLSVAQLTGIVDKIGQHFDVSEIEELSIELNPYPSKDIYKLINKFHEHFHKWSRLRFSFGIQTFDNQILNDVGRPVSFAGLVDFLRGLREIKQENMVFNFDFIAFGKFGKTRKGDLQLWDPVKLEFFQRFAESQFAESFSLYTLELFPGSKWQSKTPDQAISGAYYGTDDDIYEEFGLLKSIIMEAGYSRYELSNFSRQGVSSIHNRVYREMGNYLGLGPSASSFIARHPEHSEEFEQLGTMLGDKSPDTLGLRWTNTSNLTHYLNGEYIDQSKTVAMTQKDILIESFFLSLRTDRGIDDISYFEPVLVKNYAELIERYKDEGYIYDDPDRVLLTDAGMDVFNTIVTDLLKEI